MIEISSWLDCQHMRLSSSDGLAFISFPYICVCELQYSTKFQVKLTENSDTQLATLTEVTVLGSAKQSI